MPHGIVGLKRKGISVKGKSAGKKWCKFGFVSAERFQANLIQIGRFPAGRGDLILPIFSYAAKKTN